MRSLGSASAPSCGATNQPWAALATGIVDTCERPTLGRACSTMHQSLNLPPPHTHTQKSALDGYTTTLQGLTRRATARALNVQGRPERLACSPVVLRGLTGHPQGRSQLGAHAALRTCALLLRTTTH
jgi:hypothetical protein